MQLSHDIVKWSKGMFFWFFYLLTWKAYRIERRVTLNVLITFQKVRLGKWLNVASNSPSNTFNLCLSMLMYMQVSLVNMNIFVSELIYCVFLLSKLIRPKLFHLYTKFCSLISNSNGKIYVKMQYCIFLILQ